MKKSILLGVSLFSFSLFASLDINFVNREIKKNNAKWIAKSSAVSEIAEGEKARLLGSLDMPSGDELFYERNLGTNSHDWRNVNGLNWLSPVMNQGNCGSCVAFAAVATLEAQERITNGTIWSNSTFSPQYLFNCGGGACNFGWTPNSAASFLKKKGIVDLACAPYESGSTGSDVQCSSMKCNNQTERTFKINDYYKPSGFGGSAEKVKAALKKGPLMTTMTVYSDFMTYGSGIYKHVTGKREGGHAISLVGFNDQEKYWIIRNSWGADWGENGFARISYDDDSGIAGSTWGFELGADKSYFALISPTDHSYASGIIDLKVQMQQNLKPTFKLVGNSESFNFNECVLDTQLVCAQKIDTSLLKDGRYEVYAETNGKRSQVKELLVVNHQPHTQINFKRTDGAAMDTPFKGRVEFDIDLISDPVLPQKLIFIIEDLKGNLIAKRETDLVVEKMLLGFRFNTISNGTYKIYYLSETPYAGTISRAVSNQATITIKN